MIRHAPTTTTPAGRGRPSALAGLAALVLIGGACSGATEPSYEPRDVIGRYVLARIDGRQGPWPNAWPPGPGDTLFIIADTLFLRSDGTFARTYVQRAGASGTTFVSRPEGTWAIVADGRTLETRIPGNRSIFTQAHTIEDGGRRLRRDVGFTDPRFPGRIYEYFRR